MCLHSTSLLLRKQLGQLPTWTLFRLKATCRTELAPVSKLEHVVDTRAGFFINKSGMDMCDRQNACGCDWVCYLHNKVNAPATISVNVRQFNFNLSPLIKTVL